MYKLKKKKSACVRLREKIVMGMNNHGQYLRTGKALIDLTCFIEHAQKAKKNRHNADSKQKQAHNIVTVLIKNKYDMSYVAKFIKTGTFTIVHLGLLSDADKMDWYQEMESIIKFYGRIEYIEPDLYALVPLEVSYIKDEPKIHRLK